MTVPVVAPAPAEATPAQAAPAPAEATPAPVQAAPDDVSTSIDALLATPAGTQAPAGGSDPAAIAVAVAQAMTSLGVVPQAAPAPAPAGIDPALASFIAQQSEQMNAMAAQLKPAPTPAADPFAETLDMSAMMTGIDPAVAAALNKTDGLVNAIGTIADNIAKTRAGAATAALPAPAAPSVSTEAMTKQMGEMKRQMFSSQLTGMQPALMARLASPEGQAYMAAPNPFSAGHTNQSFFDMAAGNMDMASAVHILSQIPAAATPAAAPVSIGGATPAMPAPASVGLIITPAMHARVMSDVEAGRRPYSDLIAFEERMNAQP